MQGPFHSTRLIFIKLQQISVFGSESVETVPQTTVWVGVKHLLTSSTPVSHSQREVPRLRQTKRTSYHTHSKTTVLAIIFAQKNHIGYRRNSYHAIIEPLRISR